MGLSAVSVSVRVRLLSCVDCSELTVDAADGTGGSQGSDSKGLGDDCQDGIIKASGSSSLATDISLKCKNIYTVTTPKSTKHYGVKTYINIEKKLICKYYFQMEEHNTLQSSPRINMPK